MMKRAIAIAIGCSMVLVTGAVAFVTAQERYDRATQATGYRDGDQALSSRVTRRSVQSVTGVPTVANILATNTNGQPVFQTESDHNVMVAMQKAQQALANATTDEARQIAKGHLRDALDQQFDADMKRREAELEAIKKRLVDMETLMAKRASAKEQIIDLRLQVIEQNNDGLGWADNNSPWQVGASPLQWNANSNGFPVQPFAPAIAGVAVPSIMFYPRSREYQEALPAPGAIFTPSSTTAPATPPLPASLAPPAIDNQ